MELLKCYMVQHVAGLYHYRMYEYEQKLYKTVFDNCYTYTGLWEHNLHNPTSFGIKST